ncbi:MAG: hypothetical protein WD771_07535 [Gemmatimonadaceae bacterium]
MIAFAHLRRALFAACLAGSSLGAAAVSAAAQDAPPVVAPPGLAPPEDPREVGRRAQAQFEVFRRANLPREASGSGGKCQEEVGRFCYTYDESTPHPPPENAHIVAARDRLVRLLDSLAGANPADNWLSGQRVRYLNESGRHDVALRAAEECRAYGWWCDALKGFALHALGRYVEAETAYDRVLGRMSPAERCEWRDLSLYLDQDTRRQYNRRACGTAARDSLEARIWFYARTRYGMRGNDSRTEHFARLTYAEFVRAAPSAFNFGFDHDERELLLRFGWPRGWSRGPDIYVPMGATYDGPPFTVTGHDPTPAHRFIPPFHVLSTPTVSDSVDWAVQLPPVVARYQPPYATTILMLEHQEALFRRGDTALVVLAYDVSGIRALAGAALDGALVLAHGAGPTAYEHVAGDVPARGTLTARAPWGPLLMSAEIAAVKQKTLVRARYGIRPPFAPGRRVFLSDLLFYTPYGEFPTTVEEVLPHALPTQRVRASAPLGVYWEAYNTDPTGEAMTISLTVVPETEEVGLLRRGARSLGLARESAPVSITVNDRSARGGTMSARAVQLDISTLRRGEYLVQLEISVAGQYSIRTDRRIVVTGP